MFPEVITIPSDGNQLKLIQVNKDNLSALYQYTKSKTKKGNQISLTEKQINNLYKP